MSPGDSAPSSGQAPGGGAVPRAIALSPILSGRFRPHDLDRIRTAAPGARIVQLSVDGLADEPVEDVEVLLRGWLRQDAFERLLVRAPGLRWVHSAAAGVETAFSPAVRGRGLLVTNARGVFSRPIAEYVMTMILAISRRLPELQELQREHTWQPLEARELRDSTVGIVGLGSLGRAVASLAGAFGCRVMATRRVVPAGIGPTPAEAAAEADDDQPPVPPRVHSLFGPEGLPVLLAESDFVVLAAPLTAETENLIGPAELAAMKPGAWLINVARGALIDERALLRALRSGRLGGAVLDTFREEPQRADSPFWDQPNVILTPGTSWSSGRVLDRSIELFCDNLRRFAAGKPLRNIVDPDIGY